MDFKTFCQTSVSSKLNSQEPTLSLNSDDSQYDYYEMTKNTNELWTPYTKFRPFESKIEQLPCSVMNAPFLLTPSNFEGTLEADSCSFESESQEDSDTISDVSMIDSSDDEAYECGEGTGQGLHNRKLHTLQVCSPNNTDNILCSSQNVLQQGYFDRKITSIISDESRIHGNEKREQKLQGFRDSYPLVKTDSRRDGF